VPIFIIYYKHVANAPIIIIIIIILITDENKYNKKHAVLGQDRLG